mmetsp:Transcript_31378/g.93904  ORF Transcript_31378/g.93904 Transcript_31378/m.93904 type:complete len:220 (+) Transcript_31378:872-1531(+)
MAGREVTPRRSADKHRRTKRRRAAPKRLKFRSCRRCPVGCRPRRRAASKLGQQRRAGPLLQPDGVAHCSMASNTQQRRSNSSLGVFRRVRRCPPGRQLQQRLDRHMMQTAAVMERRHKRAAPLFKRRNRARHRKHVAHLCSPHSQARRRKRAGHPCSTARRRKRAGHLCSQRRKVPRRASLLHAVTTAAPRPRPQRRLRRVAGKLPRRRAPCGKVGFKS